MMYLYEDEDIDEQMPDPEDCIEEGKLEELEIVKCEWLYVIALYSYKW